MNEAIFPILGTAFVVLVVLPLFALIARLALDYFEHERSHGPLHGLNLRYVLLVGSSVLPLAWFLSAALHQAESGSAVLHCLFDEGPAALCFESVYFALALSAFVVFRGISPLQRALTLPALTRHPIAETRLARLLAEHPHLTSLQGRIAITSDTQNAIGTYGLVRPFIVVSTKFLDKVSDEMLVSALGHEREHLRSFDPLRYALLDIGMAVNPIGNLLLKRHVARWVAAREAHCDREAVVHGSEPLPLAEAIVCAARPLEAVALGARDTQTLRFRIQMLLAFSERKPSHCCHQGHLALPIAVAVLLTVLFLPHQAGTEALDVIHRGAEHALSIFWS